MEGFKIKSKLQFLDEIVKLNEEQLETCLIKKSESYTIYSKRKKSGAGERVIYQIDRSSDVFRAQKNFCENFALNILFPECVYGFRKRKSYFDYLVPHISNNPSHFFLRLDISDYFDSIKEEKIKFVMEYYLDTEITDDDKAWILNAIAELSTFDGHLIQGAVTSPVLSNLVFRFLDIRIEKYCQKMGIVYSRYADDLLFSSDRSYIHNYKFINLIQQIIKEDGFKLNHHKTLKFSKELSLNGYVISQDIRLSRKKLKELNKIVFDLNSKSFTGFSNQKKKYIIKNKLAGYRAFLINAIRYSSDDEYRKRASRKIDEIETLIVKYCTEV